MYMYKYSTNNLASVLKIMLLLHEWVHIYINEPYTLAVPIPLFVLQGVDPTRGKGTNSEWPAHTD